MSLTEVTFSQVLVSDKEQAGVCCVGCGLLVVMDDLFTGNR